MGRELRNAFLKHGSSEFSDLDWFKYISWRSSKIRSQCCMSSKSENCLLYIRAIQGHIEKEDKQFSSHVSILCLRTIQKKNGQATSSRNREMKHHRSKWKNILRTLSTGVKKERKTKDYNSGRHGRMPLFMQFCAIRSPRPPPKIVLQSSGQTQQQQQQQDTSESASARSWKQSARNLVKEESMEDPGTARKIHLLKKSLN